MQLIKTCLWRWWREHWAASGRQMSNTKLQHTALLPQTVTATGTTECAPRFRQCSSHTLCVTNLLSLPNKPMKHCYHHCPPCTDENVKVPKCRRLAQFPALISSGFDPHTLRLHCGPCWQHKCRSPPQVAVASFCKTGTISGGMFSRTSNLAHVTHAQRVKC